MQQTIKERFLNKIISTSIDDNSSIKLIQIINSPIPKSVKNCFVLFSEDLFKQYNFFNFKNDHFDFTAYDVRKSIALLEKHITENTILSRNKYLELIEHYFYLQLDFLCKPLSTLSNFIFKDPSDKQVSEILSDFKYFIDHTYYCDVLSHYIEEKKIETLNRNEFISIIEKINSAVIKRLSIEEIAWMPRPVSDFLNQIEPTEQIEINIMIEFFEDVKIQGIADALKLEKTIRGRESLYFDDIHKIISKIDDIFDTKLNDPKTLQVESDKSNEIKNIIKTETNEQINTDTLVIEKVKVTPEIISSDTSINSGNLSELINSSEEVEKIEYFVPVKADERFQNLNISNDESAKLESALKKEHSDTELDFNTNKYFSTSEEKLFTKKLFKKKPEYFQNSLNQIASSSSWEDAARNLDHIFSRYDIDPFSKYAMEFTNKIQSIYLMKGQNDN